MPGRVCLLTLAAVDDDVYTVGMNLFNTPLQDPDNIFTTNNIAAAFLLLTRGSTENLPILWAADCTLSNLHKCELAAPIQATDPYSMIERTKEMYISFMFSLLR